MALVDCPECRHAFSEHARACPRCGFPVKLLEPPGRRGRSLAQRDRFDDDEDWEDAPREERRVPARTPTRARAPQRHDTVTLYAVPDEAAHDNSLSGFFHGRANFWFALCVHYLGGVAALGIAAVALGEWIVLVAAMGAWAFIGLFLLLWNSKNLHEGSSRWIARILIVLVLLGWIGAAMQGA